MGKWGWVKGREKGEGEVLRVGKWERVEDGKG